jgi:hypothetical protein
VSINPVTGVEEDYPLGSNWTYNDFIKRIEDHHHAPVDSIGSSLPSAAGLPNGYAHYNTSNGEYYVNYSGVFRNFSAISYNWNVMVGRSGLSGRAFIKNGNGYKELADNATVTASINSNTASINKINDAPYWRSYHNYGGAIAMSKDENWLKGSHGGTLEKNHICLLYTSDAADDIL